MIEIILDLYFKFGQNHHNYCVKIFNRGRWINRRALINGKRFISIFIIIIVVYNLKQCITKTLVKIKKKVRGTILLAFIFNP